MNYLPIDILTIAFLAGAGIVAGIIATIVGGAAVVIYPALIATGVSPQLAAVSNLASIMPATMLAALSDRTQLPPFNRAFVGLICRLDYWYGRRRSSSVADAGADVRADRAIVARFCDVAVRLFRTDQSLAPCSRGGAWPCDCVRSCQPQGGAAGLILWWLLRRRRGHPDARRFLAGDRRRLSLGQRCQEFRLESQWIYGHPGVRHAGHGAVAADPGACCGNNRRRIDRGLCRARHSAQRRARAGCRGRCGAHNRFRAALLVLTGIGHSSPPYPISPAEFYACSRCNSIGNGVGSTSFCRFTCSA